MDVCGCFLRYIFSIFDISSLLRNNNLSYIFISPIERLKTINPGAGHLPGSFIPTPGNSPFFYFKEMLMPGGGGWALLELTDAVYCHLCP